MPTATMAIDASAEVAIANRGRGSSHSIKPANPAPRFAIAAGAVPLERDRARGRIGRRHLLLAAISSIQAAAAIRSSRRAGDRTSSASNASRSGALMLPSR